jgi:anti-anti-sigma factor
MLALAPGWELSVQRGPDWLIVSIDANEQERDDSPPLAECIWSLMEQHLTSRLVLKLDTVPVLTSYLIGQLIDIYRRILERDGVMRLCGLSAYNRRVLHVCRLDDRFPAYEDLHEAVIGYPDPRKPR